MCCKMGFKMKGARRYSFLCQKELNFKVSWLGLESLFRRLVNCANLGKLLNI